MTEKEALTHLLDVMGPNDRIEVTVDQYLDKQIPAKTTKACKVLGYCLTANGTVYDVSEQGFLGEMMAEMFANRKKAKKNMLEAKNEIEKIKHELNLRKQSSE